MVVTSPTHSLSSDEESQRQQQQQAIEIVKTSSSSLQEEDTSGAAETAAATARIHITADPTFDSSDGNSSNNSRTQLEDTTTAKNGGAVALSPPPDASADIIPTTWCGRPWEKTTARVVYVALFATFGSVLRIYMGRFFGLDCELGFDSDFATKVSSNICITNSGYTEQTGGALFIDLPANMLGSFLIGVLSATSHPIIAWFPADHRLQHHTAFAMALQLGLCGCLTTFSSWNEQMVVMLDGTGTVLGSQVASALFGYILGIATAVASFLFGRHTYDWLKNSNTKKTKSKDEDPTPDVEVDLARDEEEVESEPPEPLSQRSDWSQRSRHGARWVWKRIEVIVGIDVAPILIFCALLFAFAYADGVLGILFYREMWMAALLSPLGALIRYRLSKWNDARFWKRFEWVPWGTFSVNLAASIITLVCLAIERRHVTTDEAGYEWKVSILRAMESGFAGSLSTVSSMVKEMYELTATHPGRAYIYCCGTIVIAMLLGLAVYSPIMRS